MAAHDEDFAAAASRIVEWRMGGFRGRHSFGDDAIGSLELTRRGLELTPGVPNPTAGDWGQRPAVRSKVLASRIDCMLRLLVASPACFAAPNSISLRPYDSFSSRLAEPTGATFA